MSGLAVLILGAGRSSRMLGTDKLLQLVGGQPVIRHIGTEALKLGAPVLVTLPRDEAEARRAALDGLAVKIVPVADPGAGMGASLAAGIAALPRDCVGALLVLGDMPEITVEDLVRLADAFRAAGSTAVVRGASSDGVPGHPVVFPARLFPALRDLAGDRGARDILAAEDVRLVRLPGRHAVLDLDTPEDWAAWRSARK